MKWHGTHHVAISSQRVARGPLICGIILAGIELKYVAEHADLKIEPSIYHHSKIILFIYLPYVTFTLFNNSCEEKETSYFKTIVILLLSNVNTLQKL